MIYGFEFRMLAYTFKHLWQCIQASFGASRSPSHCRIGHNPGNGGFVILADEGFVIEGTTIILHAGIDFICNTKILKTKLYG